MRGFESVELEVDSAWWLFVLQVNFQVNANVLDNVESLVLRLLVYLAMQLISCCHDTLKSNLQSLALIRRVVEKSLSIRIAMPTRTLIKTR